MNSDEDGDFEDLETGVTYSGREKENISGNIFIYLYFYFIYI